MCHPKHEGMFGFRDLYTFNLTLLTKQGWRFVHHALSLVARVLRAKYFHNEVFWNVVAYPTASLCMEKYSKGTMCVGVGLEMGYRQWRSRSSIKG